MPLSFFFNDTATTEIYTLSLHDALPISNQLLALQSRQAIQEQQLRLTQDRSAALEQARSVAAEARSREVRDRKSTRLNSSHQIISYAVFCLKKKKYLRTISCHVSYAQHI